MFYLVDLDSTLEWLMKGDRDAKVYFEAEIVYKKNLIPSICHSIELGFISPKHREIRH